MPIQRATRLLVLAGPSGLPEGALDSVADLVEPSVATNVDELKEKLPGAEILLLWDFKTRDLPEVWHLAKNLRWVHAASAGVNILMFPALRQSDVVVTNARGVFDVPMAEYTLGLMLHFAKGLDVTIADQRERRWSFHYADLLQGRTLTIVGLGSIGRTLARLARAFEMRIVGVRRDGAPDSSVDLVYPVDRLREALAEADYVVIYTPLTEETRGLFGRAEFEAMKPGSVLVNLGRGGVVDEGELLRALRASRLRGAATDVFAQEPLPADSPLWDAPNHLLSPHIGGDDPDANNRILAAWAENVRRYCRGEPLHSLVDKRKGY